VIRLTWRLGIVTALFCVLAVAHSSFAAQDIAIRFDPTRPNEKSATIWLAYLMARIDYHEKHHLRMPGSGEIIPSLAEEVDARSTASRVYSELKEKDANLVDSYWNLLSDVNRRGFMAAYVWTFLRRPGWPASDRPSNLAAFETWRQKALPNHKAQTYGSIEAGNGK
jgi:hypothetical protein